MSGDMPLSIDIENERKEMILFLWEVKDQILADRIGMAIIIVAVGIYAAVCKFVKNRRSQGLKYTLNDGRGDYIVRSTEMNRFVPSVVLPGDDTEESPETSETTQPLETTTSVSEIETSQNNGNYKIQENKPTFLSSQDSARHQHRSCSSWNRSDNLKMAEANSNSLQNAAKHFKPSISKPRMRDDAILSDYQDSPVFISLAGEYNAMLNCKQTKLLLVMSMVVIGLVTVTLVTTIIAYLRLQREMRRTPPRPRETLQLV
ncbi:Oidioi.mRNA.OKI2018_I69.chr1.g796.t1.cds [Oikopleura dioica]|uniref:Oidioi.mRNA.OKI2018_I69.chr1.g796.t1.cds n=1 Tax=Oikopleura dioica TaxID=34765 RepID=A0ABN7SKZ5_OIKDI|nr:Oidioi.mRNA.OKI2018_I69.chr1.g796.t1.cds [Oikopleura dioica]